MAKKPIIFNHNLNKFASSSHRIDIDVVSTFQSISILCWCLNQLIFIFIWILVEVFTIYVSASNYVPIFSLVVLSIYNLFRWMIVSRLFWCSPYNNFIRNTYLAPHIWWSIIEMIEHLMPPIYFINKWNPNRLLLRIDTFLDANGLLPSQWVEQIIPLLV